MSSSAWLDESTREQLFNTEDYLELSKELNDIQERANKLDADYKADIARYESDTSISAEEQNALIAERTAEYDHQYDLLMKGYEISKAELDLTKKKQELNNTLNNKTDMMFINGAWTNVASMDAVQKAQEAVDDAEYQVNSKQRDLDFAEDQRVNQREIDSMTRETAVAQANLNEEMKAWEEALEKLNPRFQNLVDITKEMYKYLPYLTPESKELYSVAASANGINSDFIEDLEKSNMTDLDAVEKYYEGFLLTIENAKKNPEFTGDIQEAVDAYNSRFGTDFTYPEKLYGTGKVDGAGLKEAILNPEDILGRVLLGNSEGVTFEDISEHMFKDTILLNLDEKDFKNLFKNSGLELDYLKEMAETMKELNRPIEINGNIVFNPEDPGYNALFNAINSQAKVSGDGI